MISDLNDDAFVFRPILKFSSPTKRGILSVVSTIFNPLGIWTQAMLKLELVLQELLKRGLDWDAEAT